MSLNSLWKEGKKVHSPVLPARRVPGAPAACQRGVYWLSMARRWLREEESIS